MHLPGVMFDTFCTYDQLIVIALLTVAVALTTAWGEALSLAFSLVT